MKTIALRLHNKPFNEFTDIDKYFVVPKKLWDDFPVGDIDLTIRGKRKRTRAYDIPCNCVSPSHSHRLIDMRDLYQELDLKENAIVEIGR